MTGPDDPLLEATLEAERRYGLHGWHGEDGIPPELYLFQQRGHRSRWTVDVLLAHHNGFWHIAGSTVEALNHLILGLGGEHTRRSFRGLALAVETWGVHTGPDDPMQDEVDYLRRHRLLNTHPLRYTSRVVVGVGADGNRVYLMRRQEDDPAALPEITTGGTRVGGQVPDGLAAVVARMLTVPEVPR